MKRRRRNQEFALTSPAAPALTPTRTLSGLTVLGLVVNPKTKQPALATTDGTYVGIRSLDASELFRKLGTGYYEDRQNEPANLTDLPRVHTPDGVSVKGHGWGTALYTSLCLGAYLVDNGDTKIEMYGQGDGVCSSTDDRSREADAWWNAAQSRKLTKTLDASEEQREEDVDLDPSPAELNRCLDVDGTITYVNKLSVDIERETERVLDIYPYVDGAWAHHLVVAEFVVEVPEGLATDQCLPFVWKTLLQDPPMGFHTAVDDDALLALDVRGLDADCINLLALCYTGAKLGDAEMDALHERWVKGIDPDDRQGRLFKPNQAAIAEVEAARARVGWEELSELP